MLIAKMVPANTEITIAFLYLRIVPQFRNIGTAKATVVGPSRKWMNLAPSKYLSYSTFKINKQELTKIMLTATGLISGNNPEDSYNLIANK